LAQAAHQTQTEPIPFLDLLYLILEVVAAAQIRPVTVALAAAQEPPRRQTPLAQELPIKDLAEAQTQHPHLFAVAVVAALRNLEAMDRHKPRRAMVGTVSLRLLQDQALFAAAAAALGEAIVPQRALAVLVAAAMVWQQVRELAIRVL
jgi:hypothetical protein